MKYLSLFSGIGGFGNININKPPMPVNSMANKYTKLKLDIKEAIKLYEQGLTQIEVATKLGTTQKVIWHRFKEINYKCRIAKKRNQWGEKNSCWKGNKAGYKALHYRIYSLLGTPRKCENCLTDDKNKRYEWANLTGEFDNPKDYKRLCKKCHHNLDIKSHQQGKDGKWLRGDAKCTK